MINKLIINKIFNKKINNKIINKMILIHKTKKIKIIIKIPNKINQMIIIKKHQILISKINNN